MTSASFQSDQIDRRSQLEARLQLHYAIQFMAAIGAALAEPLPDGSHSSLMWHPELEVFVGSLIQATRPFQVALDPISLTLVLLDKQSETIAALPLEGKTMAEGMDWLKQELFQLGVDASNVEFLTYPPDDFPDHALAHGAAFSASQTLALIELAASYATAYQILQELVKTMENASPVRIWPHHFDIATLITLPGIKDGIQPTVGIGLSPGDTSYDEPYWYVSPYPYPDITKLPNLAGEGLWHTQHWVGAVLTAAQFSANESKTAQIQQVQAFLHSALQATSLL